MRAGGATRGRGTESLKEWNDIKNIKKRTQSLCFQHIQGQIKGLAQKQKSEVQLNRYQPKEARTKSAKMMMSKIKTQHIKQSTRLPDLANIYNLATQTNDY